MNNRYNYRWLVPLLLAASSLLAIVANSLLLLVFFKRRGLRTISNRFVINLLITNLLSSVILIPLLVVNENEASADSATNRTDLFKLGSDDLIRIEIESEPSRRFLCYFSQFATNLICISSIFGILLIGIDQYFAVIHPLRYHSYIDKLKSLILLVSIWIFSILIGLFDLLVFDFSTFWKFCDPKPIRNDRNNLEIAYAYLYFVVIILIPFVIICSIYFKIYFAARKSSVKIRKSNSSTPGNSGNESKLSIGSLETKIPRIRSAPNFTDLSVVEKKISRSVSDRVAATNLYINIKSKISNASIFFKYREETRTARISILVIFMVFVCYFPFGRTVVLKSYQPETDNYFDDFISIVLLIASNITSPFLFAYRNKRIQRELIKLILPKKQNRTNCSIVRRCSGVPERKAVPELTVTLSNEIEKKPDLPHGIFKKIRNKNWNYRNCDFMKVPESCLEARASFSSASTQFSSTDE